MTIMNDPEVDQWLDFLATPPSWDGPAPRSDDEAESPFAQYLPKSIMDEIETSSCPTPLQKENNIYLGNYVPTAFIPEFIGEFESRVIQISNVDQQTTEMDLQGAFQCYGDLESIDVSKVNLGIASIKFFDLKAAINVRQLRVNCRGRNLVLMFGAQDSVENPRKPPNNGTIVIFHLKAGVSDDLIKEEFSHFGEIRQIRCAPMRQTQRFVEYWDTRAAGRALKGMKGKKVFDAKISVEFSLPEGYRKLQNLLPIPRLPTIERLSHDWATRPSCY
jgi:hypothetical protein